MEQYKNTFSGTISPSGTDTVTIEPNSQLAKNWCVTIKNTGGSNAITSVTVTKCAYPSGNYGTDSTLTTAIGSISAGTTKLVEIENAAFCGIKFALASTSGTTYTVQVRGV